MKRVILLSLFAVALLFASGMALCKPSHAEVTAGSIWRSTQVDVGIGEAWNTDSHTIIKNAKNEPEVFIRPSIALPWRTRLEFDAGRRIDTSNSYRVRGAITFAIKK